MTPCTKDDEVIDQSDASGSDARFVVELTKPIDKTRHDSLPVMLLGYVCRARGEDVVESEDDACSDHHHGGVPHEQIWRGEELGYPRNRLGCLHASGIGAGVSGIRKSFDKIQSVTLVVAVCYGHVEEITLRAVITRRPMSQASVPVGVEVLLYLLYTLGSGDHILVGWILMRRKVAE
jgi:hypothetical protein